MPKDTERIERIAAAITEAGFDAIVCTLPKNVLMLTGYWPIVGTAIALATKEGQVFLIAPEDERDLYEDTGVNKVIPFAPGSLDRTTTLLEDVRPAFAEAVRELRLDRATIGIETKPASEQASYIAMNLYGFGILALLRQTIGELFTRRPADDLLSRERSVLTTYEQERVRLACAIARQAFEAGAKCLDAGMTEIEAAQYFEVPLSTYAIAAETVKRAGGHVACMAGTHSGNAYGSFARSTRAVIGAQDLILTHCNSHADGYWTDITRTYFRGELPKRARQMYEATLEASKAGVDAVKPGVNASDVDKAVRNVLSERGFGEQFKHGTGHGVGFAAIDHRAIPRIQPNSSDVLESGMIFNIEPGIYFEDYGGIRLCDMVLVTQTGAEVLTPFHHTLESLIAA
jgi:Xaa-Pro aminopeptidase